MSRATFADFIRRFAAGATGEHEWTQFVVQHYADIETEAARQRLVRVVEHHGSQSPVGIGPDLERIASILLLSVDPASFYYRAGAVGILAEPLPLTVSAVIAYEPYRSGSHLEFHQAVRSGARPVCEYMHEDRRYSFTVIDAPEYGRLSILI